MCKKIGIGIKVRLPKNCDTCKYCDVFQGEYWQGYCSKLKRLVDIEYKTRDAECPIRDVQGQGYLVESAKMPLGCNMLRAIDKTQICEVKCPFAGTCKKYDNEARWRRPTNCSLREFKY